MVANFTFTSIRKAHEDRWIKRPIIHSDNLQFLNIVIFIGSRLSTFFLTTFNNPFGGCIFKFLLTEFQC